VTGNVSELAGVEVTSGRVRFVLDGGDFTMEHTVELNGSGRFSVPLPVTGEGTVYRVEVTANGDKTAVPELLLAVPVEGADLSDATTEADEQPAPKPAPANVPDGGPAIEALARRITALENRPAPEPVDLSGLEARITDLEARKPPVDNTARLDGLTTHVRQLQALHGLSDKQLAQGD